MAKYADEVKSLEKIVTFAKLYSRLLRKILVERKKTVALKRFYVELRSGQINKQTDK